MLGYHYYTEEIYHETKKQKLIRRPGATLQEVKVSRQAEFKVNCGEILSHGFEGYHDRCADYLIDSPEQREPTGREIDTCEAVAGAISRELKTAD